MKPSKSLLIAALAGGLAVVAMAAFRMKPDPILQPRPGVTTAIPLFTAVPSQPSGIIPPFWTRRVGTEALVLAGSGAAVEFIDGAGAVLGTGRLDPAGAFRGTIPAGAGSLALRFAGGTAAVWRIPEVRSLLPSILADRPAYRPGDRLRICLRTEPGGTYPPVLRLEPADPAVPAPPLAPTAEESALWAVYETTIPDDAGPGLAVVAGAKETLEIPLVPRFEVMEGGAPAPDAPPSGAPPLLLERRGDQWRAEGPADAETILFFADAGGRLLSHQAVAAIDGTASTSLPLGDLPPAAFRVTAVAATPRGFLEASVGRPGPPTIALDDDAVLSRFLAERPAPEAPPTAPDWIHEGDRFAGPGTAPPARPGFLVREGSLSLLPGLESIVDLPAGADILWTARPPGAAGVVRIRGDGAILAEDRIGDGRHPGLLRTSDPPPRTLLLESGAPGLEAVDFSWTVAGKASVAPAVPAAGVSVERTLPERGAAGSIVEYRILIRWRVTPWEIVCPIPRGAVLAEEAASIRARAPAGTRVATPDGAVIYRMPAQGPGEAALSFRIRLAWPGRYAAPAATVHGVSSVPGSGKGEARSAAGFLEIL